MDKEAEEFLRLQDGAIKATFETHAAAWKPFLIALLGAETAELVIDQSRALHQKLLGEVPYIGGDANPMTRHLYRSATSLALYLVMKARGRSAFETGKILYDAVGESVRQLPKQHFKMTSDFVREEKSLARQSQSRRYPEDWVWEFVDGDGQSCDYGYDILECGTQKFYHANDADEFLPYYCYLDFITQRTIGWGFSRTMTLAEGYPKCDFRWKKGWDTTAGWPPPFISR